MHKEVIDCLLCGTPLIEQVSWLTLIQRFPTTICLEMRTEIFTSIK